MTKASVKKKPKITIKPAIKVFPWQARIMRFLSSAHGQSLRVAIVSSGYGAGKSFLMAAWALEQAKANAESGLPILLCGPNNKQVRRTLFPEVCRLLTIFGIKFSKKSSVGDTSVSFTVRTPAGPRTSTILFLGLENLDSIIGMSVAGLGIDEAARLDNDLPDGRSLLGVLGSRLRGGAKTYRVLITSTPDINYKFFKDLHEGKLLVDAGAAHKAFTVTTYDNPVDGEATAAKIKAAYAHSPRAVKAFVYGEFSNYKEGRAFSTFEPDKHCLPEIPFDTSRDLYASLDFNVSPAVAIIAQVIDSTLYVVDEVWLKPGSAIDTANALADYAKRHGYKKKLLIVGDATGWNRQANIGQSAFQLVYDTMKKSGVDFNILTRNGSTNPPVWASIDKTNKAIYDNKVRVSRKCFHLVDDLLLCTLTEDGKGQLAKDNTDRTHMADAFRYLVEHTLTPRVAYTVGSY